MQFIPVPDGHIAHVATFNEDGIIYDYQLYLYQSKLLKPTGDQVRDVLSRLSDSKLLDLVGGEGHFVIHQRNGSWIGQGFAEFREQLFNQKSRYKSVTENGFIPDDYSLKKYKNESAIFISLLSSGDYIIINTDPRSWEDGEFDYFDIRLASDGLSLNEDRLSRFADIIDLEFGRGKSWNPTKQVLRGKAVSNIEVEIKEYVADESGYVKGVICDNPLYKEEGFLDRFFTHSANIVTEYPYVFATCKSFKQRGKSAQVNMISITDYSEIGRHSTQNISLSVSLNE